MKFKKGDWVWFIWKYGVELLPVGVGNPCIPITPLWTTGPGLTITLDGLSYSGPSIYSTLALATGNNHTCVDYKGNEYIFLRSFTPEEVEKISYYKDLELLQMNPKYKHWGRETKRRIDGHTIHFLNQWLEEHPMKAEDKRKKPKHVTAKFKLEQDDRGIVTLEDTKERTVQLDDVKPQSKKKYFVTFVPKDTIDYHEEQNIFLTTGEQETVEFETDKALFQFLYDLRWTYQDKDVIEVKEERERNVDDNRITVLLGYGHKEREMLLDSNNIWWSIPTASFVTIKTDHNTYYMWVLKKDDIELKVWDKCEAMKSKLVEYEVESPEEAKARMNKDTKPPKTEKKSKPPKRRKKSHEERLAAYNDKNYGRFPAAPAKKKKKKPKEERDHVSANLPKSAKKVSKLPRNYEQKQERKPKPDLPVYITKPKSKPESKLICVRNTNDGRVMRAEKKRVEDWIKKDPDKFEIVSKQVWKKYTRDDTKLPRQSGLQPNTTFENRANRIRRRTAELEKRGKSVAGHMPRVSTQKIVIKVPAKEKEKFFKTRIHVWVPSFYEFDKSGGQSLEDQLEKAKNARRPDMDRIARIQGMIDKGYSKGKPWSPDNPIGYVGPKIVRVKKVRKVLLEKEVIYYKYTKPAHTITKTIVHHHAYTKSRKFLKTHPKHKIRK
jgi:hypothetical protein